MSSDRRMVWRAGVTHFYQTKRNLVLRQACLKS
jgi:hypothetical protein